MTFLNTPTQQPYKRTHKNTLAWRVQTNYQKKKIRGRQNDVHCSRGFFIFCFCSFFRRTYKLAIFSWIATLILTIPCFYFAEEITYDFHGQNRTVCFSNVLALDKDETAHYK